VVLLGKAFVRVFPTSWWRKPAGIEILSLSFYVQYVYKKVSFGANGGVNIRGSQLTQVHVEIVN